MIFSLISEFFSSSFIEKFSKYLNKPYITKTINEKERKLNLKIKKQINKNDYNSVRLKIIPKSRKIRIGKTKE